MAFLLNNHIGEFQAVVAYHLHRNELIVNGNKSETANALKKFYGRQDQQVGKVFCRELVSYYEGL